jgi:hypothetical protein
MYKLKSGDTPEDAAHEMLGDRRMTHEIQIINGIAYLRGEKMGPPAKWAAAPAKQEAK